MKIPITALLITFLLSNFACSQEPTFAPIVLKAKETSLYTDNVDWEKVNAKFIELTEGKENVEDMKEGLQYLLNSLGDKHATIRNPNNGAMIAYYTGPNDESGFLERQPDFHNNVISDINAKFSYEIMENHVAYLKVVGIGPGDIKEQAEEIRNGLKEAKAAGANKWILDLRYNGGGNVNPMLAGLAPLLGDGSIGGAVNAKEEIIRTYKIEKAEFHNNGAIVCEMDALPKIDQSEKLVVLLSRYTVSSGELVAIAFKGRDHTIFIGEPTAGYTTGNGFDRISDELALVISQDVFMDRNENIYYKNVPVDIDSEFQHNTTLENDLQIQTAIEWFEKN